MKSRVSRSPKLHFIIAIFFSPVVPFRRLFFFHCMYYRSFKLISEYRVIQINNFTLSHISIISTFNLYLHVFYIICIRGLTFFKLINYFNTYFELSFCEYHSEHIFDILFKSILPKSNTKCKVSNDIQ